MRNPRYDILFQPVAIGPVMAPNRFYQTPHATGMGYLKPQSGTALRALKAEGGWGVVCTEYCSIHPSSDDSPHAFLSLWDDEDTAAVAKTAAAIKDHGSLAAIELWHGGAHSNNRLTREPVLAPIGRPAHLIQPGHARAMDKEDIAEFRRWQVRAAKRAKEAGFDIVYVYAGHGYLPFQFLSPLTNRRSDEYGGPLVNRSRLLREMIEETKEAVGDRCAVAVRLAVDELAGQQGITSDGEGREVVSLLAELPDLWDVNIAGMLGDDSRSSRFGAEGFQEDHVTFVKSLTTKPVVGVGRFTSPDAMVGQIKRGILDFIGAARPSIADPFLPQKIAEGREDEIRECIGCNICRAANNEAVPLRCTQNPTIGEEWRRGWHPERIPDRRSDARVLVVGAGPAGLEAALALGRRGYDVTLAEATRELGGRVNRESKLPGLSAWGRVRDYRVHMLGKLPTVEIYRESRLTTSDILELGIDHVVLATGSVWRRDGIGAMGEEVLDLVSSPQVFTPDDVIGKANSGATDLTAVGLVGPVVVYDDDHYFMAGALAEKLALAGYDVTYVSPESKASAWTVMTDEQTYIQKRLVQLGVRFLFAHCLKRAEAGLAHFACLYGGKEVQLACGSLLLVTGRYPDTSLFEELESRGNALAEAGIQSVTRIGDCLVPSSIADAVYTGHRFARTLDNPHAAHFVRRERPAINERTDVGPKFCRSGPWPEKANVGAAQIVTSELPRV